MRIEPGRFLRAIGLRLGQLRARLSTADISFFHEFAPPPGGGGHQFLRALRRAIEKEGYRVENNTLSRGTKACLFNSYNFDFEWLKKLARPGCRMVHRVDGPLRVYRGMDDGTDERIWRINQEAADATIFQSHYSLQEHERLGCTFVNPVVIPNAADPDIFHSRNRIPFSRDRKLKLVSSSWSDNPNKGAAVYAWLDGHLDWSKYEYTFIGRTPAKFSNIRHLPPMPSDSLAEEFRKSDIYITASRKDPCSNSLVEALSCGVPVLFLNSGGHGELAGDGGLPFDAPEDIPPLLETLEGQYEDVRGRICPPRIEEVALKYLSVLLVQ